MKFTLTTVAVLVAAVSAQSISELQSQIPACAQTCLNTAISGAGCSASDTACTCGTNMAAITRAATPCVISGCSSADALKTQSITGQICALPREAASSAPASAASSAASSVSSGASSAVSSYSSAASSAVASVTSKASSAVASASSKASSAVSKASSAVAGGASPTSSSPVQASNAAGKKEVGSLMAGAAFIAALAL
ncbi:uncharacterized protein RAG0_01395 [Rhynchosporium agropyri]|uniref:CFEM domain-containing protein n=1 Tax=Rhynchosporium agropyri TaxID=914238 RepID=A0A1E1JWM6_9HELO|nr:uncharacterized protein RAG0_01395 [Rhynchosporium agropyri]